MYRLIGSRAPGHWPYIKYRQFRPKMEIMALTPSEFGYFVESCNIRLRESSRRRHMRRLGIHSFVWTGGGTQAMLEEAMENSAACGYRLIEFAYLRPEKFDLDRLAKKRKIARSRDRGHHGASLQRGRIERRFRRGRKPESTARECRGGGQGYRRHEARRHPLFRPRKILDHAKRSRPQEQHCGDRQNGRRRKESQRRSGPGGRQQVRDEPLEHDRSGPRLHQGDRLRSRHRSTSTRFI